MRSRKCYILSMSKNTAYKQTDMNMVISEPIRNPWIEMSLNAKAYFEAYRGQCRLRGPHKAHKVGIQTADGLADRNP